jgi:hypothetical protein
MTSLVEKRWEDLKKERIPGEFYTFEADLLFPLFRDIPLL